MLQTHELEVMGEQHPNDDGTSRQPAVKLVEAGDKILLIPEPWNLHDPNAVSVRSLSGHSLGYVRADQAEWVSVYARGGWIENAVVSNKWYGDQTDAFHLWLHVTIRQPPGAVDKLAADLVRREQATPMRLTGIPSKTGSSYNLVIFIGLLLLIMLLGRCIN